MMGPPLSCRHQLLARPSLSCQTQPKFDGLLVGVVREKEHEVRFLDQHLASECVSAKQRAFCLQVQRGGDVRCPFEPVSFQTLWSVRFFNCLVFVRGRRRQDNGFHFRGCHIVQCCYHVVILGKICVDRWLSGGKLGLHLREPDCWAG